MNPARSNRSAFTLIELMLVVAIMVIAMAMAYPTFSRMIHRAPISQATMDLVEGCQKARQNAITSDSPWELIFGPQDGSINIRAVPNDIDTTAAPAPVNDSGEPTGPVVRKGIDVKDFPKQISDRVRIDLVDVNFFDFKDAPQARVRFNPNGTSDEFTIILSSEGDFRKVSLEAVTGLAEVESDSSKFANSR